MGRKVAWILSLGLLFFTGVVGIYNGVTEWGEGRGPLQHSVTIGVLLYGVLGLISAYGLARRRRWSVRTVIAWSVALTYVPGVAVMAYAGDDARLGSAIAASAGSLLVALAVLWTTNVASAGVAVTPTGSAGSYPMTLKVTSTAFDQGGSIPSQYTCDGNDISPPLSWSGLPNNAKTVAIIVDDPDAPDPAKPRRVYVHWVVYNVPAQATALAENASKSGMPGGAVQGKNDWGKAEYGGPCPPIGRHRYFFKLYALDTALSGFKGATKADLERAMKGHIVDSGELMGTYQKTKS